METKNKKLLEEIKSVTGINPGDDIIINVALERELKKVKKAKGIK